MQQEDKIIEQMTLEEKAAMCAGKDFWHTQGVKRLGVNSLMLADGPLGLRKQETGGDHLGIGESIRAVCFPAGCAVAATFNTDLAQQMGETIGEECLAENVDIILGPAINIKRNPLCGRNFEYYSEDPVVATEMATAFIKGVQSKNVGTCVKHFLANNQENYRMIYSSDIDERTMREIYLKAFEKAIVQGKPWSVMCSYNRINGVYSAENKTYLMDVLRKEWGFDGFTVSDWGAVNDRIKDLEAGLDVEMPPTKEWRIQEIKSAVMSGKLSEEALNRGVRAQIRISNKASKNASLRKEWSREKDHEIAKKIAEEAVVLLKNDGVLPVRKDNDILLIGCFAEKIRYQGGGSSHVNSYQCKSLLECLQNEGNVTYRKGFGETDTNEILAGEVFKDIEKFQRVIVCAGLPESWEVEGKDREHIRLPENQNVMISRIAKRRPDVIVILQNGSVVEMPWKNEVAAIVEAYLGGEAVAEALSEILLGEVNPSGRLPETFPVHLADAPCFPVYKSEGNHLEYREGIFVGYRYYDTVAKEVLFPFGYGLSYTHFSYRNMKISTQRMKATDKVVVSVEVVNDGNCDGKEVIQVYVAEKESDISIPLRELKRFKKVLIRKGESVWVEFELDFRDFAHWDTELHSWHINSGIFSIQIGRSSREIVLEKEIYVEAEQAKRLLLTINSTIKEIVDKPEYFKRFKPYIRGGVFAKHMDSEGTLKNDGNWMQMPIRNILCFGDSDLTMEQLIQIIDDLNKE